MFFEFPVCKCHHAGQTQTLYIKNLVWSHERMKEIPLKEISSEEMSLREIFMKEICLISHQTRFGLNSR